MSTRPSEPEPEPGQDAGPEPTGDPGLEAPPAGEPAIRPGDKPDELLVFDHGFVRLDDAMADDLSVVNAARVSFAVRKEEMDERDKGLIRFLMRERHGTPFEHNSFRFHVRAPIFVAREWFRHRVGCLTRDAVVTFVDTNGTTTPKIRKTMEELWEMWSRGERDGHALTDTQERSVEALAARGTNLRAIASETGVGRRAVTRHLKEGSTGSRDARWRVRGMRLRVLNERTNEFEVGHIQEVVDSGVQSVYRITLEDGKQLTMTENHRLLTTDGWATLADAVGLDGREEQARMTRPCSVLVNGEPVYRDREWVRVQRARGADVTTMAQAAGCSYHTIRAWLRRHGLQFKEEERNFSKGQVPWNEGVRGYRLHRTTTEAQREAIRRARSGPRSNFWRGGLTSEVTRKGFKLAAHSVRVVSLEYLGRQQTYDLCVAGPWHNFVANGIVVHNSFNEESARYHKLEGDFYLPSPGAVRTQVGKPGAYTFETAGEELAAETVTRLRRIYGQLYTEYQALIERGVAKELARTVLPFGVYTQFYWTLNARSLMNFLSLRNSENAQYEIRTYAEAVERLFADRMPVTHDCFVEFGRKVP